MDIHRLDVGQDVILEPGGDNQTDAEIRYNFFAQYENYMLNKHATERASEYPPVTDYLDAVVKGDDAQKQEYIDACLAVKEKYPKVLPEDIIPPGVE